MSFNMYTEWSETVIDCWNCIFIYKDKYEAKHCTKEPEMKKLVDPRRICAHHKIDIETINSHYREEMSKLSREIKHQEYITRYKEKEIRILKNKTIRDLNRQIKQLKKGRPIQ